jgi:hypothetical protein
MRRALVVGIDDNPVAPLAGCVNDAVAIAERLSVHEDGSPNFDCRLLTTPTSAGTRGELREAMSELFRTEADIALFYFSGHGTENDLGGYLVTPDASTYDEGVSMGALLTLANKSPAREVVIVLDCCSSGAFGQLPAISNDGVYLREGIAVLTATRSNQDAIESGGAGLFTALLRGALDGGAADVIGNITVAGMYAYVDQALGAWDQRPLFMSHLTHLAPVRRCAPAVSLDVLRQLPAWFPTADAEMALDPSFEPDAEPQHEENQRLFGMLQQCRAAKLVEPVGELHMYYAAMNNKSCRLTPLGRYYWQLANTGRI